LMNRVHYHAQSRGPKGSAQVGNRVILRQREQVTRQLHRHDLDHSPTKLVEVD